MKVLNKLGGKHGVGRVDMVENRFVGMKIARRVRDARRRDPALRASPDGIAHDGPRSHAPARLAHPEIRRARLQRLLVRARARGAAGARHRIAEERDRHRAREALQGQHHRRRPQVARVSLYNPHIATMEADPTKAYNQNDATGFIRAQRAAPESRAEVGSAS